MSTSPIKGRPPVYVGSYAANIAKIIRDQGGLKNAQKFISKTGVQSKPGTKLVRRIISLPTLAKLAKRAGIKLVRGRKKLAA